MIRNLRYFAPVLGLTLATIVGGQSFTPGRIAVLEYTTGSLSGGPYLIREFAKDGTPTATFQVPSTGQHAVVGTMNWTTGSQLARSPSGDALFFTGFASTVAYPTSLTSTSSAQVPRVVGRMDASGNCTREYATNALFSAETMTQIAVDDSHVWTGSQSSGVCLFGPGTQQVINPIESRGLRFDNGQLYSCTNSGTDGVLQIGQGSPTAPTSATSLFPVPNALDVQFSPDGNTAYAVYGTNRVRKMVWNGSVWTNPYDLFCAPSNWLVRIAVDFNDTVPVIYGVHNAPSKLVKWTDLGAGSPEELLYQATGQAFYYGIAFTPANCTPGAACDDGDPATPNDVVRADCTCSGDLIRLSLKVWLEGPYNTGSGAMLDVLRGLAAFPQSEPYSSLGLPPTYAAGATLPPGVLTITGVNAIVDWLLVELREDSDPAIVVSRVPALLQRDGDVVALDGVSELAIPGSPGQYHVAVCHRNHLPVMTLGPLALGPSSTSIDLTQATTPTYGSNARKPIGNTLVLWAGDLNGDGQVKYTGIGNDRDLVLNAIGGTVPTATLTGQYGQEDLNLNGLVRYTGGSNDRDLILQNIGGTVPTAVRHAQLP
ncbi:MAG: hypothetical protein IPM49_13975 [Flavobacteriales bacterium]|nr:hypothetical protein [Flavobacteriales bacterium]